MNFDYIFMVVIVLGIITGGLCKAYFGKKDYKDALIEGIIGSIIFVVVILLLKGFGILS